MERFKELFDEILIKVKNEEDFSPEEVNEFNDLAIKIGEEKTSLNRKCDANVLLVPVTSLLIGDVFEFIGIPEENINLLIGEFMNAYPDDFYFLLGCLALVNERGLDFEGEEVDV